MKALFEFWGRNSISHHFKYVFWLSVCKLLCKQHHVKLDVSNALALADSFSFTSQCCAIAFIEKLDAQSLNLSPEEFELYMSDQASPDRPQVPGIFSPSTSSSQSDARVDKSENDLIDWRDGVEASVQDVLEGLHLDSRAAAPSSAIDSDNVDSEGLPPPLQPHVFAG